MPVCWQGERRIRRESPGSRRSWSLVRDSGSHDPHTKAGHRQAPMFSQGAEALSGTLTQSACETAITHSGAIRMLPGAPDAGLTHQCGMRNQAEFRQESWSTCSARKQKDSGYGPKARDAIPPGASRGSGGARSGRGYTFRLAPQLTEGKWGRLKASNDQRICRIGTHVLTYNSRMSR